jgi:regulator of protease activity HflC (stomatin/prohibitin superfamily)
MFLVWNPEKCILEVENFERSIALSAQTALRESIGRQSVEIRDVHIPPGLEDAMSRQAQAERERQARIVLGTAEAEISAKFAEASKLYIDNPVALHLRAMNMLYEAIKEKGSMVIVPSSAVETMNLGSMMGTAALAKHPN